MNASSKARQAKRRKATEVIVIDDGESASEQEPRPPPPPLPNPEVVALKEKVAKLEDMYKKACRSAGEEKERAERAEKLLDNKRGVLDETRKDLDNELEMRLVELSKQLAEARRSAEELRQKQSEYVIENDAAKVEMVRLRRSEEIANRKNAVLARENAALKGELDELRRKAEEDRARIDDLTYWLAKCGAPPEQQQPQQPTQLQPELQTQPVKKEPLDPQQPVQKEPQQPTQLQQLQHAQEQPLQPVKKKPKPTKKKTMREERALQDTWEQIVHKKPQQPMQLQQLQQLQPVPPESRALPLTKQGTNKISNVTLHRIGDPNDIFQLCLPQMSFSISLDSAITQIGAVYEEYGKTRRYIGSCTARELNGPIRSLKCVACGAYIRRLHIVAHFLSEGHVANVRACGAAVSRAAVAYWQSDLEISALA